MKKIFKFIPIAVFLFFIYAVSAGGIIQKDKTYSSTENRILQSFPKLNKKRALNGKFQQKYEIYLSDQFPGRDTWVKIQTRADRVLGRTEANGVYFGKDDYLFEHYSESDFKKKQVSKNIAALKEFVEQAGQSADVKVMMVPSKTFVLKDKLPLFAETYDENIFYNMLKENIPDGNLVDVNTDLNEHLDEYIFYRTDHHWTTLGAWYGYRAYLKSCADAEKNTKESKKKKNKKNKNNAKTGTLTVSEADIETKKENLAIVANDFLGTTHSKVNIDTKADGIAVYNPSSQDIKVVYNLGEKTEDTYYQMQFLEGKDKYSIFFGGNQGLLEISAGAGNKKTILIIKDSFANCMIPFLADDFGKVVVADMRQLNINMSMLLRQYNPTNVLVLYNTVQFMQDKEFAMK